MRPAIGTAGATGDFSGVSWSPTGNELLATKNGGVILWSRITNRQRHLDFIGDSASWLPDERRIFRGTPIAYPKTGYDVQTGKRLGTLIPVLGENGWLLVGPEGHYRGSEGIDQHLLYVTLTEDGRQETYTPAAFAAKFGWKNDPSKVK